MSNELTMGVFYEQAQEEQKRIIETLSSSLESKVNREGFLELRDDLDASLYRTTEVITKEFVLGNVLDEDVETGVNRNMIIPKKCMPEKVLAVLEPFDIGNGLYNTIMNNSLNKQPKISEVESTSQVIVSEIGDSIDRIDCIDPELRAPVPNDQELAASLAIDIIGEGNFIIPVDLIKDEQLFVTLDRMDIADQLSHDFKQSRIDKYYDEHESESDSESELNIILNRLEDGKKVPVTDPSEREEVLSYLSSITGVELK